MRAMRLANLLVRPLTREHYVGRNINSRTWTLGEFFSEPRRLTQSYLTPLPASNFERRHSYLRPVLRYHGAI